MMIIAQIAPAKGENVLAKNTTARKPRVTSDISIRDKPESREDSLFNTDDHKPHIQIKQKIVADSLAWVPDMCATFM